MVTKTTCLTHTSKSANVTSFGQIYNISKINQTQDAVEFIYTSQ